MPVDFQRARQVMVDGQVRAGGVTEPRLLSAMLTVPRELFVPQSRQALAYVDDLHWFGRPGASRFMPAPATIAKLLHLAEVQPTDSALDIGAATGYASALLAGLAASVTALEQDAALAGVARANLAALGMANASVLDGGIAAVGRALFDVIIVQGMLDSMPDGHIAALNEGGRLVALIRKGPVGVAHVFVKAGGKVTARAEFSAFLPPLDGAQREVEFVF